MRSDHVIVVEMTTTNEQQLVDVTVQILVDHGIFHLPVPEERLAKLLTLTEPPLLAIAVAATPTIEVIDTLRQLVAFTIPTIIVLEDGKEHHELTLLQSGAWEVLVRSRVGEEQARARIVTLHRNLGRLVDATEARLEKVRSELRRDTPKVAVTGLPADLTELEIDILTSLVDSSDQTRTFADLSSIVSRRGGDQELHEVMDALHGKLAMTKGGELRKLSPGASYRFVASA